MLKRLATLLLGIGLIGLGVLLFVAPGGTTAMQWLTKLWPAFLILGGLVRVAGFLIDRHPRSPVGGMMITAVGGILLSANLRGDRSLLLLFGQYWFWLLLALMIGRILRQYLHRVEDGKRPRAFSPGALVLMVLLVGGGLGANYLAKNRQYLSGVEFKLGKLGHLGFFGSEYTVEDESPQTLSISPEMRLLVSKFKGDVEISALPQAEPTARLIKRIRASNQEEANQVAKNLHLQTSASGKNLQFSVNAGGIQNEFSCSLIITLPSQSRAGVDAGEISGKIKLSGLLGAHVIRDTEHVEISNNTGKIIIENPRGAVELSQIQGEIRVSNIRSNLSLREVNGAIAFDAHGGSISIEQSSGPVQARVSDVRLTISEIARLSSPGNQPAGKLPLVRLDAVSNSRLDLQQINGAVTVNAERSRIEAENIVGDLTIKNSFERVQVNRINGALKINSENSTIEIEEVKGSAEIATTSDVTVRGFHGPLSVTTSSGTINLATDGKLAGNLKATSERGRIRLSLPEDSEFKLDAGTQGGRIRVRGFDGLSVPNRQRQVALEHNASPDSPAVVLRSSSGNIELQSSGLALASRDEE
jgi:DUF4097 and DUF4098 domain-containing protein YvlB